MVYAKRAVRGTLTTPLALAFVFAATGCGYVKRDDFESEVNRIRDEMRTEDTRLEGRIDGLDSRMTALEGELESLETEFGARVERMEQSLRVHTPVHFGFDQANIEGGEAGVLDRLGSVLQQYYPGALITVEGFTDAAGSQAYNIRLGQERADAVRDYLVSQGLLSEGQVRTVSYGEDSERLIIPDAFGPTEGRENRRVVIVIDHPNAWNAPPAVASGI